VRRHHIPAPDPLGGKQVKALRGAGGRVGEAERGVAGGDRAEHRSVPGAGRAGGDARQAVPGEEAEQREWNDSFACDGSPNASCARIARPAPSVFTNRQDLARNLAIREHTRGVKVSPSRG